LLAACYALAWWLLPYAGGQKLEVGSPLAFSNFVSS